MSKELNPASGCTGQSDCSDYKLAAQAWEQWFAEQTQGGDEWTSIERIAARDAWMSALRWSGYISEPNAANEPRSDSK